MNSEVIIALIAAAGSSWGAVGTLGWWLSGRFRAVEYATAATIEKHEQIDQQRHEENLENFAKIRVSLARRGITFESETHGYG